jgi:Asp-tRNA(Asn)/Glu-tRNA(Gln) amidotransferase B subunit
MVEQRVISSSAGREVLTEMLRTGHNAEEVVDRLGLRQVSDAAVLTPVVAEVIGANVGKAAEYRAGRAGLLGFFVGQVMRRTGGSANPEIVKELIEAELRKDS